MKIFRWEIGKKKEEKEMKAEEKRRKQLRELRENAVADLNELTVEQLGIVDQAKAVKTILDMELDVERVEAEKKEKFWKTLTFVVVGGVTVGVTILDYKLAKEYAGNVWSEQAMDKVVVPKLQQTAEKLRGDFSKDVNGLRSKTFNKF